jgi:6-phosphogluconolactonase
MLRNAALHVHKTRAELNRSVAEMIAEVIEQSIRERGSCTLVLAGGKTPRPIYGELGSSPLKDRIDWSRVHLLFGDERMVPPDDPRSNFGMVQETLLSAISIPPLNVHRIVGENDPIVASREYDRILQDLLSRNGQRIDCVLLGLGKDGHTASLFPGSSVVRETKALALPVFSTQTATWRVTMTLPLINAARQVIFIVSGKEKAEIVHRLSHASKPGTDLPATLVQPRNGKVVWMIDREAAAGLA